MLMRGRVLPVLKEAINSDKIDLISIINTHQYVFNPVLDMATALIMYPATMTTPAATPKSYAPDSLSLYRNSTH